MPTCPFPGCGKEMYSHTSDGSGGLKPPKKVWRCPDIGEHERSKTLRARWGRALDRAGLGTEVKRPGEDR